MLWRLYVIFLKKRGHEHMCRLISGWFHLHRFQTADLEKWPATARMSHAWVTLGQWPGIVDTGSGVLQNSQLMWYSCLSLVVRSCSEYGDLDHK